jgi:hypothetical protein
VLFALSIEGRFGDLRISEALSIRVDGSQDQTSWDQKTSSIRVRCSIYRNKEQARLKTFPARRTVDLDPQLSDSIAQYVAASKIQPGEFLFKSRTGGCMYLDTAKARLAKHGECAKGFHAFRRFRITHLREFGVPEDILRFWVGHSGKGITDRYSKLSENSELRKQWASRCGLGFEIPKLSKPGTHHGKSTKRPTPSAPAKAVEPTLAETSSSRYLAQTEDLDPFFYQPGGVT